MGALKYAMVGGGPGSFIGEVHRKALLLDRKAELIAGCFSRDIIKSRVTAAETGTVRVYEDYREMIEKESTITNDRIDFVVIATPNNSHYEIAKLCLEKGFHVACDKPLTITVTEAETLEKLANERNLLFLVTHTYMGYIMVKHARDFIKSGALGDIRIIMAEYSQSGLCNYDPSNTRFWRADPQYAGSSLTLGDIGTHIENAVATFTGLKIKRILAKVETVIKNKPLDDNDYVLVEFDNGASGVYWASQVAVGKDNELRLRIFGSEGYIEWNQEDPEVLLIADKSGVNRRVKKGHAEVGEAAMKYRRIPKGHGEGVIEAMANLYSNFCDCIAAIKNGSFTKSMIDYPTVYDGVNGMKFIEACLKSSRGGNVWINL